MIKQIRNDTGFNLAGNKKLGTDIAVLNLAPSELCSSRVLGTCQLKDPDKECYSLKESRTYGCNTCLPNRFRAMNYFAINTAWQMAQDLININATRRNKIKALRISESGDFFTQADVDKCELLAAFLWDAGIRSYVYTARPDLCFADRGNLVVNGSGWLADNRFQIAYNIVKNENAPGWTCKDKHGADVHVDRLCPGDCRKCDMCLTKGGLTIGVLPH